MKLILFFILSFILFITCSKKNISPDKSPVAKSQKNSKRLNLKDKDISDLDFYRLNKNPNTEILILSGNKRISNRTCPIINELDQIRELHLDGTSITASGLLSLNQLNKIEILFLPDSFSDNDIAILTNFNNVYYLQASKTMTENSLINLYQLKNITHLDLSRCYKMDIKAIHYLISFQHLKYLVLPNHFKNNEISLLNKKLNNCKIIQVQHSSY